ncbi:hypothetical protein [Luteolibacter sp. Populi]|uniref:hypothetical protein n=1 Tax=Luteolibacter sp. Populi TaxID=3230487 RepID=UPI003465FB7E
MRNLIQKKWFRITARVVVCGVSLLVLAYLLVNWRGAVAKQQAVAAARAVGMPLTVDDFTSHMPPPEQNFARTGIAKEWEDAFEKPANEPYSPWSPRGIYESMGDPVMGPAWSYWNRGKPRTLDFRRMAEGNPYGRSPATFLAEYDRRHGEAWKNFQAGFDLPYVRRPLVPPRFAGGSEWFGLEEGFGLSSRKLQDGLFLRAEAALATGDSAKAAESIVLGLRLADLIASKGTVICVLVGHNGMRTVGRALKSGIGRHLWKKEDLELLSREFQRLDLRSRIYRGIESEALMIHVWEGWKEDRARFGREVGPGAMNVDDETPFLFWFWSKAPGGLPAGWFDMNAAALLDDTRRCRELATAPGPVSAWFVEGSRLIEERSKENRRGRIIVGSSAGPFLLKGGAVAIVDWRLMIAACEIERYFLEHGSYPAGLEALPPELVTDPFNGGLFCYAAKDGKFTLYSKGPDGKDDGGAQELLSNHAEWKDWVW